MDLGLKGKVVLITGGSKGIGLACAQQFCTEGARVAIASRDRANLDKAKAALKAQGHDVVAIVADLTRPADAKAMVADAERALGPIDILVNSAGAAKRHAVEDLDAEAWASAMNAKFFTYIHTMDAIRPGMIARKSGAVVNIIGMGGKSANPTHLAGGAANAALMLVSTGLAAALAPHGIRVNAINPGATDTERVKQALRVESKVSGVSEDEIRKRQGTRLPMGRIATPDEVAAVTLFLASKQASYVTGATIPMDGGSTTVI